MKKHILFALGIILILLLPGTSFGTSANSLYSEYFNTINQSIMRPGMDTVKEWMQQAKLAPRAYIDPAIARLFRSNKEAGTTTQLNLLNHLHYVPSERNQGSCGNCWNWAGQGVLGIALHVTKGIKDRLSTQFVNSCKDDRFACCGGWLEDFTNWYAQQGIAISWSNTNAYFADGSTQCQNGSSSMGCVNVSTTPNYSINSITTTTIDTTGTQSQAISNIKNVLAQNKAIWFGFFLPNQEDWNQFMTFWSGQDENTLWSFDYSHGHQWTENGGGHAVLLVGYNEDAPQPYWILLNSWGAPSGRPNGLFRMKMDMKYDLFHYDGSRQEQALYFQTLDVQFSGVDPSECSYSVFPTAQSFNASGGSGSMQVNVSSSSCTWSVSKNVAWINNISPSSGTGNGTVTFTVAPNKSSQERQGIITVEGNSLTITQKGAITESNLLKNAGFEDGLNNTAWVETGPYELMWNAPCYTFGAAECAHGGEWVSWFGGYNNACDSLSQTVSIPTSAESATLRFWYAIDTWDYLDLPYDTLTVWVYNGQWHSIFQLSNMDWSSDWVQSQKIDISSFIGQTITVHFEALTDETQWTNFYIDDVELLSGTSALSADIKANGSDGPITVSSGSPVSITIYLSPGASAGQNADWWVAATTPFAPPGNWYTYVYPTGWSPGINRCIQTGLFEFASFEVMNRILPPGAYTFYFAIDDPDGLATGPWWGIDSVGVTVE